MEVETSIPKPGKWNLLREALGGSEQDFTQGDLTRGIALLAIPTILEMAMESTFGLVDAFFVARLGADAIAAVGLTESMVVLVFSVALGMSMAATATVARRIGEKDPDGAAVAAVQAVIFGVAVAIPLGFCGAWFAPTLLGWMHASPGVIAVGSSYTAIILGGNISIVLIFILNGIFRGCGDPATAMRVLVLANGINIVLDPCLIYGLGPFPAMGVTGAAVATATGRSAGVLYQFYVLFSGGTRVKAGARHLRIDWPVLRGLLRMAWKAMFQYFIATASWMSLARINASFGSAAVAGYTIGIRVLLFAILPSWGICSAAATLVGQNLGAKQPARAERSVWLAGSYNTVFLTVVGIVFFATAPMVVRQFSSEPDVIAYGVDCLRFVCLGYPFYAWGMVMEQAFNGAGDTATPTWINFFCYWMLQIPLAWWLADTAGMGPRGVYLAICGAESVLAVVSVVLFRRGRWKTVAV